MDQDSEVTELLRWYIATVHQLLIQHLPVAKQTIPYIVHFFPQCVASGRKKHPHLSHNVVKLIEISYLSSSVKELYVILRQMSSVC